MSLPKKFMIGAATAAHQVEGNNIHSDYWAQEQMKYSSFIEPSLDAVDHYDRYEEDIRLMAEAGLNAYRFSIEWARIEPEQGKFDKNEIEHYRKVILCCKQNKITPIVTMHHFSSPRWLIENGGWEAETTVESFARYCRYVAEQLGNEMEYVCTINEANMGIQIAAITKQYIKNMQVQMEKTQVESGANKGHLLTDTMENNVQVGLNLEAIMEQQKEAEKESMQIFGTPNPQVFVSGRTHEGDLLVMRSHEAARNAMKAACPHLKIGLTLSLHDIQPQAGAEERAAKEWEEEFTHYLPYIQKDDFLGVQNYTRTLMGSEEALAVPEDAELTQMDYEFYPEALGHVIRKVSEQYKGEIIVTENGVATANDARRIEFVRRALEGVEDCIADGIPVKGYLYWSLLDNFEWQKGYSMTFGLIAVDRSSQKRMPKLSLRYLGSYRENKNC